MEFGFDKEIDAILRKARAGEVVTSSSAHLDADEISAFAENALPEPVRQFYTTHLADCTRCRKILSNVIALNSEAETETASSIVPAKIVEAKTPWYRKLFVLPQIAYAMGALVVLFSGFFGYIILKNLTNSGNSEVSFSTDKPNQMDKSAPQAAPPANSSASSSSNSTTTANSTTTTSTANSTTNSPSFSTSNTATVNEPADKKSTVPEVYATPAPAQAPIVLDDKPQDEADREDDRDKLSKTKKPDSPLGGVAQGNTTKEEKKRNETEDAVRSKDDNKIVTEEQPKLSAPQPSTEPKNARKQKSLAGETRSVGGKTFNNVGGIWFDSAYTNQKQKTVNRGTNDYQKLDSGLRSIADQFSETVVVLWKSKAYRIQ